MVVLQIIVFLLGLVIAVSTLFSAIKETVLPGRKKSATLACCVSEYFSPVSLGARVHTF